MTKLDYNNLQKLAELLRDAKFEMEADIVTKEGDTIYVVSGPDGNVKVWDETTQELIISVDRS